MAPLAEMLNAVPGITLTPEITNALAASRLYDMANAILKYQCASCKRAFDEDRRGGPQAAAANTHGEAITPQVEAAISVAA